MCWRRGREGSNAVNKDEDAVESSVQFSSKRLSSYQPIAPMAQISQKNDDSMRTFKSGQDTPLLDSDTACMPMCRWQLCLCFCCIVIVIVIVIIITLIFFVIVPTFAQSAANHVTMDIVNGTMYNPTNESIELSSTLKINNVGMFDATMYAHRGELWSDGYPMGYIQLSEMHTAANTPSIVTLNTTLIVTNASLFQDSCRNLLKGIDHTWQIKTTHQKVSATIGGITFTTHVNLNKGLLLPGAPLVDFQTKNVRVVSATETVINTVADLRFRSNSILTFDLPPSRFDVYMDGQWVANAPMAATSMKAGLNLINDSALAITKTSTNRATINRFLSAFISGKNQFATFTGPNGTSDGSPLVIDGVMEEYVLVEGDSSPLTAGGVMTAVTQAGWNDINGTKVRGAYTDVYNSLDVPFRVLDISADLKLPFPIRYNLTFLNMPTFSYHCYPNYTTGLAHITLGSGTWKHNLTKTWVDVPPKSKVTVFVQGTPLADQKGKNCLGLFPFPCCWAGITPAVICYMNPQLQTNINDQLTYDYLPGSLIGNFTVLVDNQFETIINYYSDDFPLYFGYEVYDGTLGTAEMNCNSFKYY